MAKHKQLPGLAEGIYFNLPEEVYHNDPALSHSGMVNILESPLDHWMESSALNPDKPKFKATDAMFFGKWCHKFLLEGMAFFEQYNVHGMKPDDKKLWISRDNWIKVHDSIQRIRGIKEGDEHFKFGYPEVSLFWRDQETGMMQRARVDYLRTFGAIDYKRLKGIGTSDIGNAIAAHGLDIQDWHYSDGIRQIRKLLRKGKIKPQGDVAEDWLKAFMDEEDTLFRFFFQRSTPPFIWEIVDLDQHLKESGEEWARAARAKYKANVEAHGLSQWPAGTGKVRTFELFETPRRIHDRKR
jgi:hypothetical protein